MLSHKLSIAQHPHESAPCCPKEGGEVFHLLGREQRLDCCQKKTQEARKKRQSPPITFNLAAGDWKESKPSAPKKEKNRRNSISKGGREKE